MMVVLLNHSRRDVCRRVFHFLCLDLLYNIVIMENHININKNMSKEAIGNLVERIIGCVAEELSNVEFGNHDLIEIDRVLSEKYRHFFTETQKRELRYILDTISHRIGDVVWKNRALKSHFADYLTPLTQTIEKSQDDVSVEALFNALQVYLDVEIPKICTTTGEVS